jgi:hypothetical protein
MSTADDNRVILSGEKSVHSPDEKDSAFNSMDATPRSLTHLFRQYRDGALAAANRARDAQS